MADEKITALLSAILVPTGLQMLKDRSPFALLLYTEHDKQHQP
jgi:hypothetical protein